MTAETPRWNAEAQRWQSEEPTAYAPPPPPLPQYLPHVPGSGAGHPATARRGATQPDRGPDGATVVQRGLGRKPVIALAVTAVLIAVGTAVWLDRGDEETPPAAGPGPSVAPTAPSEPDPSEPDGFGEPSPSSEATYPSNEPGDGATATKPAPGFQIVDDEEGFTLAVPEGWERTSGNSGVFYTAADERSLLQIFTITEPGLTPLEAVGMASDSLSQNTEEYREYSLGPVTGGPENPGDDAAELHYAYLSETAGGMRECIERAFTATDGEKYAVLACAPAEESPYHRTVLETALEHFAPGLS